MELTMVINDSYGGFSLNSEMAEWLRDHKGWLLTPSSNIYPSGQYDLVGDRDFWSASTAWDDKYITFRSDPDLIECVRQLKWKYRGQDRYASRNQPPHIASSIRHANDLQIVRAMTELVIMDEYDGIEKVGCEWHVVKEINPESDDDITHDVRHILRTYGVGSEELRVFRLGYVIYPGAEAVIDAACGVDECSCSP